MENTTASTIDQVRVEVHLSNGTELGPTTPVDLAPGETTDVTLPATSTSFDTWSAHPESGASGDGSEHEGGSEGSEGESGEEHHEGGDSD